MITKRSKEAICWRDILRLPLTPPLTCRNPDRHNKSIKASPRPSQSHHGVEQSLQSSVV